MIYRTIDDKVFDLNGLSESHMALYQEMRKLFLQNVGECEFANTWRNDHRVLEPEKVSVKSPIYRILADMQARISVRTNWARLSDWRKKLERFIEENFRNKRDFCKETGIDETHLCHVLKGRKGFSIDNLEQALAKAGIQIIFMSIDLSKTGEEE